LPSRVVVWYTLFKFEALRHAQVSWFVKMLLATSALGTLGKDCKTAGSNDRANTANSVLKEETALVLSTM